MSNQDLYNEYKLVVETELTKRKSKWHLTAVPSVSYEDVCQIIRTHIFNKINLYNPEKSPFSHWVNAVISSQLYNILRNEWGNSCSPCNSCPFNQQEDLCGKYGHKTVECKLYGKWVKSKKAAHEIRIPATLELHSNEILEIEYSSVNIEESEKNLHARMLFLLKETPVEQKIYQYLFVDKRTESETGRLMGYKASDRGAGYRQIKNIRKKIALLARQITYNNEIDIVFN